MITLLNLIQEDSNLKDGWVVGMRKGFNGELEYYIKLGGDHINIENIIDPVDYFDLTTGDGIIRGAPSKIVSVRNPVSDQSPISYTPIIKLAEPDEDTNIMFVNFEGNPSESIIGVELINCKAVNSFIWNNNFSQVFTIIAVGILNTKLSNITIKTGIIGGKTISRQTMLFPPTQPVPSTSIKIEHENTRLDGNIEEPTIVHPILDLESICIN